MDERDKDAETEQDEPGREDAPADQQDPESAPASNPPPGIGPGEGKEHDL